MINYNVGCEKDIHGNLMFGIYKESKQGEKYFIPKGEAVLIKEIISDIDSGDISYKLEYNKNNRPTTLILPCENLNKAGLLALAKSGVDVTENNVNTLIDVLQNQRFDLVHSENFNEKHTHKQLGWSKFTVNDKCIILFKGYNTITKNDNLQSVYDGDYYVKPRGSLDKWKDLINQHVLGTNLEIAVIFGLSACVNAYIGREVGCENMIIHIMGESTTGKTTAGMLALSTATYPDQNLATKESLFRTWNSTKNAMFQPLVGNAGFPVLFDEFSMNKDYSITDLVYALANGKDKSRLNKECEQKKSSSFQTTIISTGEASLFNKCSNNTGLLVRIIEFSNVQWTESAEQSNAIKQGVRNNCGWAILEVAKYILTLDREDILNTFYDCKQEFLDNLKSVNNFSDRIASKYAMLLLTTIIAQEALGIDFDYDSILKMLLENEENTRQETDIDIGTKAYDKLAEYIETHRSSFKGFNIQCNANTILGKFECTSDDDGKIIIPVEKFKTIMKELGFEDTKPIIKKWKENNLLDYEQGKNTRKRFINNGKAIACYVISYDGREYFRESEEKRRNLIKKIRG